MLRDVFYYGAKPNAHPREQFAENLVDARTKCTTEHFWVINEFCDYRNFDWDFDFEFLPDEDVWAEEHNNVWPSQHQKDSGTWLCPNAYSDLIIYRGDVEPVIRKNEKQSKNWVELDLIDHAKFDFSWHPDPSEPPYIYKWGCKFFPAGLKHVLEYHVPAATQEKYMNIVVELLPQNDLWIEHQKIDKNKFDLSWRPSPLDPPFIYIWGNKYIDGKLKPTLEYRSEGATERKYMPNDVAVLPESDKWKTLEAIMPDSFDFTWRPDPREPALIYVFGNEMFDAVKMPTVEYHCTDATERKYMDNLVAKLAPNFKLFEHLEDSYLSDYSWLPDPDSPPYIYVWGNQWNSPEDKISVQVAIPGATEYKYMSDRAIRKPCMDNWIIPDDIDTTGFDFSWEPSPAAPPYIYEFATQWQKTGGPQYVVPGATEKQYISFQKAKRLLAKENWTIPDNIDIDGFDFSWHPDATSPPYIYVFATQWAFSGGPVYTVPGATESKYIDDQIATATPDMTNWVYDAALIDVESFDFSWHPYVEDQPYVYEFGTQHQQTGGPRYITPGADSSSPIKYIDTRIIKSTRLHNAKDSNWKIINDYQIKDFDWSWHPDSTDEPFIYVFGNNQYPAEEMSTIEYRVAGATQIKFVNDIAATLDQDLTNWDIPIGIDTTGFDFSWKPNPTDPGFIYEFGTQHQKTGGPRYAVPGAIEIKYLDFQQVVALSNKDNWKIPSNVDVAGFDFSWHPDNTDPGYIYQFGTQWALNGGPSYCVPDATEIKYMDVQTAIALPSKDNWVYDSTLIDVASFDFSWHPYVEDQPYVYEFGTQHQKTGGPRYITPGADSSSPSKYIDTRIIKSKRLANPTDSGWKILNGYKIKEFDYSWHPDSTDEPYIYVFGNNLYPAEEMPTIEYHVPNAKQVKYINDFVAVLDTDMNNWDVPKDIDVTSFDFSWKPNPTDPAYIYEFGTQHQKTGGPRYIVKNAIEVKYLDSQKVTALADTTNWVIPENIDTSQFDFSWHPDATDPAYTYQFGTQWALSGGPAYTMAGATEIKYMDIQTAIALPNKSNWVYEETQIDVASFDFSWHPYAEDQPYIYQFGTQWQKTGGPRYITPGATATSPTKYVDTRIIKATRLANKSKYWEILNGYEIKNFDYSWHPDETTEPYIYVFGNTQYSAEEMPTIQYVEDDAESTKYINNVKASLAPNMANWDIPKNIDESSFDFSWVPHPKSPPYIYEFATVWNDRGGPRYVVPGATEHFYVEDTKAKTLPARTNWDVPKNIDETSFDFSWVPHPLAPPFIYQFGTQHQKTGGPRYITPGATATAPIKYVDTHIVSATRLPNKADSSYKILHDIADFDFSWHPDDTDEPYIYVFGNNQYSAEEMPTIEYLVKDATEYKYITNIVAVLAPNMSNWDVPKNIDTKSFDFSWVPHPSAPPYIYEFATVWNDRGGPKYIVPNATEYFYVEDIKAKTLPSRMNWEVPDDIDTKSFDFSWVPHPLAPPYIYQFGTLTNTTDGPRYITPNNNGEVVYLERVEADGPVVTEYYITTTLEDLVIQHPNEVFWAKRKNIDYANFDFMWRPESLKDLDYVQVFGSQDSELTQTYFVNSANYLAGKTQLKFIEAVELTETTLAQIFIKPDMFFVDKGNADAAHRFEQLKIRFGNKIQKTRYLNSWVDTVNRCINRSTTDLLWVLNSELDYSSFDFNYYPNPWQMNMVHVFGTQWNHWGTTFMVNRETFAEDSKYIKIIEHLPTLNFVKEHRAIATDCVYDIVVVDHGNDETSKVVELLQQKAPNKNVTIVKYDESYLNTIRNLVKRLPEKKEHYLWICSSVCNYNGFDLSYVCDPFAKDNLHVFPSGIQKFGDTFLIDVNKTREIIGEMSSLEDYYKVNYNGTMRVERLPAPQIVTTSDTLVDVVKSSMSQSFPYSIIMTEDNINLPESDYEPMNLWTAETKNIIITSTGATRIIAPREVSDKITKELYDYPYIKRAPKLIKSNPIDIVFLSNGETCAEEHYEHLLKVTDGLANRVVRVDGVNGRAAAYHAAAEASETPWMFTVFAKLKVSPKFDFNWQPDRMQVPKHYIFHAKNPVNGLTYGHQAMIAYNKKLTLANEGRGLDFTLDDEHEIVPLLSGTAYYNTDSFSTWRTAFREVLKLKADGSDESSVRLDAWLNKAEGEFGQFSIKGALDADEYYEEVNGEFNALKLSYEWSWLRQRFDEL